jgi:hypothetical protein
MVGASPPAASGFSDTFRLHFPISTWCFLAQMRHLTCAGVTLSGSSFPQVKSRPILAKSGVAAHSVMMA